MAQDDFLTFVERVKQAESRGQRFGKDGKLLTSSAGAQGEMQVMPATQRRPGFGITPVRDDSPDEIARVGRDLLKALDGYYGGNKMYAAAAYNWGKSNVDKWIANGADFNKLPKETQGYLKRIQPETLPSMVARKAPAAAPEVGPAVMEPPLGISASAAPTAATSAAPAKSAAPAAVAAAPIARAEDLGSGYKAALALSFLGSEDKDRPTTDSELEDRLNETALAEFNKELEDYTPKNALADVELTALNPAKFMQPVKMASGGMPFVPSVGIRPSAKKQLDEIKARFDKYNADAEAYNAAADAYNAGPQTEEFTMVAPRHPSEPVPVNPFDKMKGAAPPPAPVTIEQYEKMAADAKRDAINRRTALAVVSDPERYGLSINKFFADGGEVDSEEMLFSKGNTPTGNSAPPRFAAQELEAFIKAANPGAQVLEYERGPGDALGFVHSKMPDVLNIKKSQTPGTKEQTTLHELEHSLDARGGDILGRPDIAGMDNNYRAYYLMNKDWRPIESFVSSVVRNKDKLRDFFGQDIVSGYITMDPETLKKLKIRDRDRALFAEQIASLSALEQATGKSLTRDPEMRKIFPNTQMMAVYDALTGLRQTRTDARDLPPHTPLPSYMYETNPITRFIREKTTGKNEYGIPVKRSNGSPETGERAPTAEELEAASRPAFLTPKSGINRKISTKPGEIESAVLQGVTETPYNLLGMPVDLATMAMRPFGYDVKAPVGGSEWIKEKMTALGVRPEAPTQPTQRAFYELGQIGGGAVNPAAPVRGAVKAARAVEKGATALGMKAEKALEGPVTRTLEGGGRSAEMLRALGAQPSYAVRPKGGHFELRPDKSGPGMAVWDDVKQTVSDTLANTKDQPLNNWFNTKYATYLRRDFAAEGDPFVKAADAGKKLHIPNEPMPEGRQKTLSFVRKNEGLPPQGFATTPYGKNVEDALDASLNIRELGDLAGNPYARDRVPQSIRQFADTDPNMRVYSLDEILESGPHAQSLRDRMLFLRQNDEVRFYGEPPVKIPDTYRITNEALLGMSPVQASEKVAQFENWQQNIRQRAASSAIRKDPNVEKIDAGDGSLWINTPDLATDEKMRELVKDIGRDARWCTKDDKFCYAYGSGNSRLTILVDGKSRPVAQMTIDSIPPTAEKFLKSLSPEELNAFIASNPLYKFAQDKKELAAMMETSPQFAEYLKRTPPRMSITEIKGWGNKENLVDLEGPLTAEGLKKIQDRVKTLDAQYDLRFVENLSGIGLTEVPRNRPDAILDFFSLSQDARLGLKNKFGSETEGFRAILNRAINMNGGSKYFSGNEDDISNIFQEATRSVLQPPVNRAKGGMVERTYNDNRAYL